MAKKEKPPVIELNEVEQLVVDYIKLCGQTKANAIKHELTDDEFKLFMYEVKSQIEALDTENKFDISAIEDLAKIRVQENRLLRFQKDLLEESQQLKDQDEPGLVEQSVQIRRDALKLVNEIKELNATKAKIVATLSASRDQRLKVSNESRITLPALIKQLDDKYARDKAGVYGELLKKAAAKKHSRMVEDGLIMVAKDAKIQEEEAATETSVG